MCACECICYPFREFQIKRILDCHSRNQWIVNNKCRRNDGMENCNVINEYVNNSYVRKIVCIRKIIGC